MPQIPQNKNIKNSQIIASNRTPYPGYNQPPRDPKPNPILEGLQEAAKATYHFCKISLKTCLFVGGVLLSGQLIGINQDDNKSNPFHCNANPNDAACKTEPSITPTTTSTFIPTPTPTPSQTLTPTATATSTSMPTSTPTSTPTIIPALTPATPLNLPNNIFAIPY